MSYLLPGFTLFIIIRYSWHFFPPLYIPTSFLQNDFEKGLFGLVTSLSIGLLIHRLTFWLIRFKWYKKLSMPTIGRICKKSPDIRQIKNQLDLLSKQTTNQPLFIDSNNVAPYFFDYAYCFLEVNDKIGSSKSFQSLYFFLRNLFTIALLNIPLLLTLQFAYYKIYKETNTVFWTIILSGLVCIPFLLWIARFCRTKMVERVFWSFYILKCDTMQK